MRVDPHTNTDRDGEAWPAGFDALSPPLPTYSERCSSPPYYENSVGEALGILFCFLYLRQHENDCCMGGL